MDTANGRDGDAVTERTLGAIREAVRRLSETIDDAQALSEVLFVAAEAVDATGGAIWRHDPVHKTLVCQHAFGEKADSMTNKVYLRDDEGVAGRCFQTGLARADEAVYLSADYARRIDEENNFRTDNLLTLPLLFPGGMPVGVIQLVNKRVTSFSADDQKLLESIASMTAMRLHVADLAHMAARTAALDYVGHFAHDIYNRLSSSYTGVPTFGKAIEARVKEWDDADPTLRAGEYLQSQSEKFLGPIAADAKLIYRYTRLIAQLVKTGACNDATFKTQDVGPVLGSQVNSLRLVAREKKVEIVWKVESADGKLMADFDEILLGSALYNLLNNALVETPNGKVSVVARATPDNFLEIHVRDTGRGMPPAVLESILAGKASSTHREGTGLGTLIIKRVAERHGGKLHGSSVLGTGTTFTIRLPLTQLGESQLNAEQNG